jgi:transcriptional regulator with GAF, ATPase, and Fis domain/tetratricopeptide (TPR) repeat protein
MTSAGPPLFTEGERMQLGALDLEALRAWTQGSLSDATLRHILAQTGGNPARIELALRRWTGPAPSDGRLAASAETEADSGLPSTLIHKTLEGALPAERERLALLAALDGQVDGHEWGLSVHDFAFGFATGLLDRDRTLARLSSLVDLPSLRAALSPELQKSAHRKVAAALSATTGNAFNLSQREAEIIRHLALAGARHEASERLASAQPFWRVDARPFLSRVAELHPSSLNLDCQLCFAEMALLVGEARRASSLVAAVLWARPEPALELEARLLGAAALTRLGRGARAERLLGRVALREWPPETRARISEHVARARIARGDYAGAKRAVEEGLALGSTEVTPRLREALGIAALYGGEVPQAEAYFSEVLSLLGVQGSPRDRCRLLGYRAIAAFRAGHATRARDDHAQALEVAESHGLDDLICVCSLNLGTALQQLGDLGGAFERYERGLALSRAVGRESTELVLLFNRLNIQVEISDLARAEADVAYLERRAKQSQLVHFAPALELVRAEIALKTGALSRARDALERAASGYEELGLDRERVEVELCRAELEIAEGALDAALARALSAKRRAHELDAVDLGLRSDMLQGRIDAERGDVAAVARLGAALDVAERQSQQLIAAKLATELWLAVEVLGLQESDRHAEHAHRLWDRLAVHLTEAQREVFWSAPPRSRLLRSRRADAKTPADERAGPDAQALLRLLSLSRRINSSLSMDHVLKYAVDAAVELSAAERGFLLLRDDARGPVTLRARTEPDAVPSQTVIEQVMSLGEPLITTDAEADARLMGQRSVHAQRLKAILCVPIGTPSELMGTLYVDSRVHRAPLTARARDLLMALADQVAVALSNVRLHASLEQRSRELAAEKQTVERLAQGQDRELRRLREQIESQRRTLEFRYDYAQIVGRGPGMRAVLTELDRIVDADVNVLIQGESGTGKELIARAIHVHGPRKAGPFVAINCAALPESLLESELFGYVRGAFTGADRDKTGLMLAARGGTLFLDELGELPLSTQAKLLRVLQEREVRPLGSERALPLDVRLVCATHRELLSAAANGEFRQDLFYRVAVVTVRLPPLRERVEDLPELARAILNRLAKSADRPAPELGRDALRALSAHPFPGNIRELENILTRAFVISGGPRIGARDLELNKSVVPAPRSTNKRAFAIEERQRILSALNATRWNVSVVSRTLGIPRNTLYRKLQRYGLTRD